MKKRKKPILLLTILVVLVGIVFAINNRPTGDSDSPKPPEEPPATGAPRTNTPDAKQLASAARANQPGKPPMDAMPPEARRAMGGRGGEDIPSVELPPTPKAVKPKPNDSSISGQWYSNEARQPGNGG